MDEEALSEKCTISLTKFQDDVRMTRKLFTMMAEEKEDELLPFRDKMRDAFLKVSNMTIWIL